jgi:mono/diheme cytochrome c family protein
MKRNGNGLVNNARRLFGIIAVVLPCVVLPGYSTGSPAPAQRKLRGASQRRADDLYRTNCARCHGAEGHGDTPLGRTFNAPDFSDQEWWEEHAAITNPPSLAAIVRSGKGGMPAFGKKLTRSEINTLVGYVRRFRRKTGAPSSQ